jgi:Domain of unknown function (DUF4129)
VAERRELALTVRLDPPLDPTSPEARQWLEDELRRGVYHEQPGLLARLWEWFQDLLGRGAGTGGLPAWTLGIVLVVAVAVVALVVARSVGAERRMAPRGAGAVLDGPARPATEHRAAARAALAAGDEETAVLEAYRAITRAAIERTILDELPGRTAHEVSLALAPVFPASHRALTVAADDFDAVRYGDRRARPGAATELLALDAELSATRPVLPDPAAGAPR